MQPRSKCKISLYVSHHWHILNYEKFNILFAVNCQLQEANSQ